ncbi:MAG: GntR family transcriptional regulator, partial [bacterium]
MEQMEIEYKSMSSQVAEYIKKQILSGVYEEGEHLVEKNIAKNLGVSRAPVRDAMRILSNKGLIESIPHKGHFVVGFSQSEIKEIFEIRLFLEKQVLDDIFENNLLDGTDYKYINELTEEMMQIAKSNNYSDYKKQLLDLNKKDVQFHKYLWDKSNKGYSVKFLKEIHDHLRLAMIIDSQLKNGLEKTAKQHID